MPPGTSEPHRAGPSPAALQHLDLRNNSLVGLHNVSFQGLGQLESLNLSDNSLMRLKNATLSQLRSLPRLQRISLSRNPWVCDCNIEDMVNWLKESNQVEGKGSLSCSNPEGLLNKPLVKIRSSDLNCSLPVDIQSQLQTSYVFLGIVLALIGAIFLLVLYLNRKGIKNISVATTERVIKLHQNFFKVCI
uniref:LRRCT domain-containing protein n=1 Tax=Crocodylus porosus TaxID=8502 RepID=A0A7M4FE18_CROPO